MRGRAVGSWRAIGAGVGTALGVAFKTIPVGVAVGVAAEILVGAIARRKHLPIA